VLPFLLGECGSRDGGTPGVRSRVRPPSPSPLPRWARCPVDRHLHLLAPVEVAAAGIEGHGRAGCGRLIPRAGLTIDGGSVVRGVCGCGDGAVRPRARPVYDPWRNVERTRIHEGAGVEQIAVAHEH
jgi:hypothetical protein